MNDTELAVALEDAIAFHCEALEAFRHDGVTRRNGQHARSLAVLRECQARLVKPVKRRIKPAEPDERFEDAAPVGPRLPYPND